MVITNHTFSNLVMRPPGLASEPDPVDEPVYKALGDAMAAENGYVSQYGYELYDTSGDDRGLELLRHRRARLHLRDLLQPRPDPIDPRCSGNFHPTFPNMIAEYEGTSPDAPPTAAAATARPTSSPMEAAPTRQALGPRGQGAPRRGAEAREDASDRRPASPIQPMFEDHLETEMKVPDSGNYDWHINPSTRPLVAQSPGAQAQGPPSPTRRLPRRRQPATTTPPGCRTSTSTDPPAGTTTLHDPAPGATTSRPRSRIEWTNPVNDWDLKVFPRQRRRRQVAVTDTTDGEHVEQDGGRSATGATDAGRPESATFVRPETADGRLSPATTSPG